MGGKKMELLAPAGSMEALKAAVRAGADAVYLGAALFGARASAGFDENALREAIRFAHLNGRKIHVTVNTLCRDEELPSVLSTLDMLQAMHVDAVLIQDLGILKLCRERFPALPIHASTQMTLHNATGARFLQSLGVKRIVLARECTLPEIRLVADTGIETEVFAHGAMCVCVSGQCLFSSMIGGRSGNRGRCAQPCRLPYRYHDSTAGWLSPADLCTINQLPQFIQAGVTSLKIEGRLKRPEYVYTVTKAYRQALDLAQAGHFEKASEHEMEQLTQIFSRGAFTKGYAGGAQDAGIIYEKRVTPIGIMIGTVQKCYGQSVPLCDVLLSKTLHNGDGLELDGQTIIYSGKEVSSGGVATLRLHEKVLPGTSVRRTEDEQQLSEARAAYSDEAIQSGMPLPFDAHLDAAVHQSAMLTLTSNAVQVQVAGDVVQPASSKPLSTEYTRKFIKKTGGTQFLLHAFDLAGEHAFLSAASLNALRRNGLCALADAIIRQNETQMIPHSPIVFQQLPPIVPPRELCVRTENPAEIPALLEAGADRVLYSPQDVRPEVLFPILDTLPQGVVLCLPTVCEEQTLQMLVSAANERQITLSLGSIGQAGMGMRSFLAGSGIPVMNGEAEQMLASLGAQAVVLSPELSVAQVQNMPAPCVERMMTVYGRTQLMLLTHCPERTARGCSEGHENCSLCAKGIGAAQQALVDRRMSSFPLLPQRLPEGCRVRVLHEKPTNLLKFSDILRKLPVSWLLDFTLEAEDERLAIVKAYKAAMMGESPRLMLSGTIGRAQDGVL